MTSRIVRGLVSLRGFFHRFHRPALPAASTSSTSSVLAPQEAPSLEPRIGATEVPPASRSRTTGLRPISIQASVPADRVGAITAELNFRIEHILRRAMEEQGPATASTLVMLGVRVEDQSRESALLLH